jgi:hypothetical protein
MGVLGVLQPGLPDGFRRKPSNRAGNGRVEAFEAEMPTLSLAGKLAAAWPTFSQVLPSGE